MTPHRWKNSWPGNFCLDCGAPDPLEEAVDDYLVKCNCVGGCEKCSYTGAVLDPKWKERITSCPGPGQIPNSTSSTDSKTLFIQHLEWASLVVSKWPEWKKRILKTIGYKFETND